MSASSKPKKGNAFGRLFKSKKKTSLSSQDAGVSVEESKDDSFLLNETKGNNDNDNGNGKAKSKSRFRRNSRSKQNSPSISGSLSNKENQKSTAASDGSSLPRDFDSQSQSNLYVLKKEQVVTSLPQHSSHFQPFYDFKETKHCDDQVGVYEESRGSTLSAPSDEIGDPFLSNDVNALLSPETPKRKRNKETSTVSTPESVDFNCTFKDAWSVFCTEQNATSNANAQKNAELEVAQQFQVRVDVLEDLRVSMGEQDSFRYDENESLDSEEKKRKSELLVLTRSALSRPFGRTSLPAHLAKTWVVEVSFAGFDKGRNMCTYNIMVQKEEYNDSSTPIPSPRRGALKNELSMSSSFVAASIDRTLQDFLWLEEAMMHEYSGSLIFPLLSLALTSGTDWANDTESFDKGEWDPLTISMEMINDAICSKEPTDTKLLSGWLTDVLNSIRGKGELILDHKFVDIIHSEAMESFLYMTSEPLPNPSRKLWGRSNISDSNGLLGDFKKALNFKETGQDDMQSTLASLVKANLQCLGIMDDDINNEDNPDAHDPDSILSRRPKNNKEQENVEIWRGLIQSNGLLAQRFYIAAQKENTLRAMYQLKMLLDRESLLSAAWKRFAISLSMLFASEKDIEVCRLEGDKPTSPSNSSRVGKTKVDDNLRILARQKVDRSVPSLKVLSSMLNSYYSDFSSVDPSLREYAEGLDKLMKVSMDGGWQSQLKAMTTIKILNAVNNDSCSAPHSNADKHAMQERLSTNEEYMKSSIMQLCKAMKIRVCRMGWKFFKMEAGQVSLLLTSAEQVRSNLKSRRIRDASIAENEKGDNERDGELVRIIMELGLKRKYKYRPVVKSSASSHTSSETSIVSDFDRSLEGDNETLTTDDGGTTIPPPLLEPIMTFARERAGRWNADVVEKILQASGIHNARFDIGTTSKCLRSVSKLAASLRESVTRCKDAVRMLQQVHTQSRKDEEIPIEQLRRSFLSNLAQVFSGTCESGQLDPMYEETLSSIGIDVHDSSGWLKTELVPGGGQCGTFAIKYQHVRHHGSEGFFSRMISRLESYDILIEEINNYIWMHRVADYIEKYYSNLRADALAAWEKKTDITTAINIATKKRLALLVKELKEKLEIIGNSVSYTSVKEAKERHLGSKALKVELENLASRRFQRLRATCAEHSLSIINEWTLREESATKAEIKSLKEVIQEIENNLRRDESAIKADGGAHLFASTMSGNTSSARSSVSSSRSRTLARND